MPVRRLADLPSRLADLYFRLNIVRIEVGKNPRGIVINSTDTRAYVMNFISRDVSVVDIQTGSPRLFSEIGRISSASLPKPGTLEAIVHDRRLHPDQHVLVRRTEDRSGRFRPDARGPEVRGCADA